MPARFPRSLRPAAIRILRRPLALLLCLPLAAACAQPQQALHEGDDMAAQRERMVERQIVARGVHDARVLDAMRQVPRHRFVDPRQAGQAYDDRPLPIGSGQTISQPYIVARMTELVRPQPGDRALEIGTGSGYQAAVLSPLVARVYTIEIIESLAEHATRVLADYDNVTVRHGDGFAGWPEQAPFDVIVVTAAPEQVPQALLDQLAPGGRMVIPVGPTGATQQLRLIEKLESGRLRDRRIAPVLFVPMTGGDRE